MNRVIITGATGFIGSHIVEQFCQNNISVGCLIRESSSLTYLKDLNVVYHYGDIRNFSTLVKAFKGYDTVIHNAAYVADWGDYDLFYRINVYGTQNVLFACIENNIQHIILTGSNASYGEENNYSAKDESFPYRAHYNYFLDNIFPSKLNYYRETKAMATEKAAAIAEKNNLDLTILEPVWVFGEREFSSGFYEYMKSVKDGMFIVPGSRNNKFHVIYAPDCAQAFLKAYKKRLKGIHRILIGNKKPVPMHYIYSCFLKNAGLKKPIFLPKWIVYPAALILEFFYTILKIKTPPLLSRARVNMFYDNIEYSVKNAEELLGFMNNYSLEDGICRTVSWYKQNHYI